MNGLGDHQRDEAVPAVFMRHVGNLLRCTCGLTYVAGYTCPGAAGRGGKNEP